MNPADEKSTTLTSAKESPADYPLFRQEVIEEQRAQWLGSVLLTTTLSHTVFVLFAILSAAGILALLFFADYSRTEKVSGWLVPELGLVQVYSPRSGVISQLNIEEGGFIQKGGTLFNISSELQTEAVGATQEEVVKRLGQRLENLRQERKLRGQLFAQQITGTSRRIVTHRLERKHREQELDVQTQLVELAAENSKRLTVVRKGGVISEQRWLEIESERLDQLMAKRVLERDLAGFDRERMSLESELAALPLERDTELSVIDRRIDEIGQELAEAEARRKIVIQSPQTGTITSMRVKLGSTVTPDLPILSIIPEGSDLEAELFLPTRAIGFIRPGQKVLLRYRAFPYQKFGHYEGTIASVSRSTLSPSELSPQVRSVSSLKGLDEPVYMIKVRLARQNAIAYGEAIALQPGMQLDAEVFIEKRRLIEWVLDPLYTLTGSKSA